MEVEDTLSETTRLQKLTVTRWVRHSETRGLEASIFVAWFIALASRGILEIVILGLASILLVVVLLLQRRVAASVDALLAEVGPDAEKIKQIYTQMLHMPQSARTLSSLRAACQEGILPQGDGLTCYERGKHTPTCPHRRPAEV